MIVVVLLLIIGASLSPLLTLLKLWQLKEWRVDRLKEHLKREGMLPQLYGSLRPIVFGGWLLFIIVEVLTGTLTEIHTHVLPLLLLIALTILSIAQIGTQKQPMPVWTRKAELMFSVSLVMPLALTAVLLLITNSVLARFAVAILPMLCPLFVVISWIILRPLDMVLKKRILRRAISLRASHDALTVIGITGSVGKTTTKELLAHILKKKGALSTPVHVNTEMGVAAWLTNVLSKEPANWNGILIVEMGAYRKGEIRLLAEIAKPSVGIITSIGLQHLSLFGTQQAIIEGKGELFAALPENGHAFFNLDNEASRDLPRRCRCPVTGVGTDGKASLNAFDIEETGNGIRFTVDGVKFSVPLAGTHTVTGILLAIAAAKHLGMTLPEIAKELCSFTPLPQTFEVKTIRDITVLDDTYNASPDSFRVALDWAARQPQTEKVLLTDGIIELGEAEDRTHAELALRASKIFSRAYIGSSRVLAIFRKNGFGDRAFPLSEAKKLSHGGLLVCIGRVSKNAIDSLLPSSL